MLKSRVFNFNASNLLKDIETYKTTTGRYPKELQGSSATINVWANLMKGETSFTAIHNHKDKPKIGSLNGIPITINELLDDGTINIV